MNVATDWTTRSSKATSLLSEIGLYGHRGLMLRPYINYYKTIHQGNFDVNLNMLSSG